MLKRFLVLILLLFAIPICFAKEDVIRIGLEYEKNVSYYNIFYRNTSIIYSPTDGYEIDSVMLEAQWKVVNYSNTYKIEVRANNQRIYFNNNTNASSMNISIDVTDCVVNSSGSIKTDIEFAFSDSAAAGFDVPNCTAKFIVKLKPKTTPGTTIKAPIPPLAIILALMAIPIIALKRINS